MDKIYYIAGQILVFLCGFIVSGNLQVLLKGPQDYKASWPTVIIMIVFAMVWSYTNWIIKDRS